MCLTQYFNEGILDVCVQYSICIKIATTILRNKIPFSFFRTEKNMMEYVNKTFWGTLLGKHLRFAPVDVSLSVSKSSELPPSLSTYTRAAYTHVAFL